MLKEAVEAMRASRGRGGRPRPADLGKPLGYRFLADRRVLLVEPSGPIRPADFDVIAQAIDPWRESRGKLRGLVIAGREFPGWENVAGFVRHVQFVRERHHSVDRVAVCMGGEVPRPDPVMVAYFIRAPVGRFDRHTLDRAIEWAGGGPRSRQVV